MNILNILSNNNMSFSDATNRSQMSISNFLNKEDKQESNVGESNVGESNVEESNVEESNEEKNEGKNNEKGKNVGESNVEENFPLDSDDEEDVHDKLNENFNAIAEVTKEIVADQQHVESISWDSTLNAKENETALRKRFKSILEAPERAMRQASNVLDKDDAKDPLIADPKNDKKILKIDNEAVNKQTNLLGITKNYILSRISRDAFPMWYKFNTNLETKRADLLQERDPLTKIREMEIDGLLGNLTPAEENLLGDLKAQLRMKEKGLENHPEPSIEKEAELSENTGNLRNNPEQLENSKENSRKRIREASDDGQPESSKKQKETSGAENSDERKVKGSLIDDFADPSQEFPDYFSGDD